MLACYLTDSNVELRSTFERTAEGGLIIRENGEEHAFDLDLPLLLDLEKYSVKDMARICTEIME